ncbi:DNA-binding response regulator, OmpR family, contains REC and winged-helix (wHTH) domain [Mesobacillus persicus]|uniref:DNA-binding response regulator, OmpR family, contains REC and winged-helix (WHTH) domain n=1 Tax=Mesobacillus persicus TaxID=930146 RepID=A0A1H8JEZ0_9BACI|nr:response regulator transcription factor [Mesobacillus persicus]SEN79413.1 DNA-binding response regulator, OmpR family, contains REC and winged-helix (wHTH) domain [Mesobacillus persicus]
MYPVKVLIIDDEEDMRDLVQIYLENSGYRCYQAASATIAYEVLEKEAIDLVILDIMMPEGDGYAVCETIRSFSQLPIIFLSAKGEEWDKVKALQLGGDDYIVKPFSPGELVARIAAVLRRTSPTIHEDKIAKYGKISIDKKARRVNVEGEMIPLTLKEYELLNFLIEHSSQALSREQLLEHVWGMDYIGSLRTVDTHIKTLRMKLGIGDYIQTIWGIGYKFEVIGS